MIQLDVDIIKCHHIDPKCENSDKVAQSLKICISS